jgi:NADPH:quinone reductase-like Zn-dependent oxidoreductase
MGILEGKGLGLEGSGVITEIGSEVDDLAVGDRTCYSEYGRLSTRIKVPTSRCARIPGNIAFDEAATMPCVFGTAIHCLLDIGRLKKGESVLIHSACGGVGIAAIQICQNVVGAEVSSNFDHDPVEVANSFRFM